MATVRDIVTRSLRKIGVIERGETAEASDMSAGVDALNDMLHGWKLRSVDIEHTDLTANDPFPLADEFREGAVYVLASRISPDYSLPQAFDADDWFRTIQAAYAEVSELATPDAFLYPPSRYAREGKSYTE